MTTRYRPFLTASLVSFVLLVGAHVLLFATLGAPASPEGAGEVFGRVLFTLVPGVIVAGWLARRAATPWSKQRIALVVIAVTIVVVLLTSIRTLFNGGH
jgi:hypothetical protein